MLEALKAMRKRESYLPSNCVRTNRIMCLNGDWYFLTRESCTPLGPYLSKREAAKAALDYVAFAAVADEELISRCYAYLADAG
ncbi:MAG: hypothetical protein H6995_07865 [Pseudomonadales bacterium]|nr:hypothetical protein [Pseudomonadales bacterium]MCP5214909.1 hypothetical protein [Pseudomonadales bacterium]